MHVYLCFFLSFLANFLQMYVIRNSLWTLFAFAWVNQHLPCNCCGCCLQTEQSTWQGQYSGSTCSFSHFLSCRFSWLRRNYLVAFNETLEFAGSLSELPVFFLIELEQVSISLDLFESLVYVTLLHGASLLVLHYLLAGAAI